METLTFENASETEMVINTPNEKLHINYNRIIKIASSVFADYEKTKKKANLFIIGGIIVLLVGALTQLVEKKIPESQVHLVEYRSGFKDYQIQPKGWGTSIYPVILKEDGYYYARNYVIFGVIAFVAIVLMGAGGMMYETDIMKWKKYYKNNRHSISVNIGDGVIKEFYVGDFDKTKNTYEVIKSYWEKSKMK